MSVLQTINFDSIEYIDANYNKFEDDFFGYTSTIYRYKEKILLKLFDVSMTDYSLFLIKFLDTLVTKTLVKAQELVVIDGKYYGYTVEEKAGKNLLLLSKDAILKDYFKSLLLVEKDIIYLSKKGIITTDLKASNILYDPKSKESNIIDTDSYYLDEISSTNFILKYNLDNLYDAIFTSITSSIFKEYEINTNGNLYVHLLEYYRKNNYSVSIDVFFTKLIEIIENYMNTEVKTVRDVNLALSLRL